MKKPGEDGHDFPFGEVFKEDVGTMIKYHPPQTFREKWLMASAMLIALGRPELVDEIMKRTTDRIQIDSLGELK